MLLKRGQHVPNSETSRRNGQKGSKTTLLHLISAELADTDAIINGEWVMIVYLYWLRCHRRIQLEWEHWRTRPLESPKWANMVPRVAFRHGVGPEYITTSVWICLVHFLSSQVLVRSVSMLAIVTANEEFACDENSDLDYLDWLQTALSCTHCLHDIDMTK